jgi:hypothetical protein
MSAQIIQFGKPQSRKRAAEQPDATASSMPLVERTKLEMHLSANTRRRRKIDEKAAAVRCRVDGKLYEVRFHGGEVLEVLGIHHRTSQDGRIAEIKRRHWAAGSDGERDLDRRVVLAAWRERSRNDAERASRLNREASIAQLLARRARLLHEAEKVKATIALMRHEVS